MYVQFFLSNLTLFSRRVHLQVEVERYVILKNLQGLRVQRCKLLFDIYERKYTDASVLRCRNG